MASRPPGSGDVGDEGGLGELDELLGFVTDTGEQLEVELPFEPHDAAKRLLAFLGVEWTVVPVSAQMPKEQWEAWIAAGEGREALDRMDAGEPQKTGRGEDASPSRDGGRNRRNGPEVSAASKIGRRAWTPETVLAGIHEHVREHRCTPTQASDHKLVDAAKRVFGSLGNACETAGYPRPKRGHTNYCEPLDSADDPTPSPPSVESSGPSVDESVITGSAHATVRETDEPTSSRAMAPDTRAPEPLPDPGGASPAPVVREPRTNAQIALIPDVANQLEDEATYLRARADALERIAAGVRRLAEL